ISPLPLLFAPFFLTDTAPAEIYTPSLHDALPISRLRGALQGQVDQPGDELRVDAHGRDPHQVDAHLLGGLPGLGVEVEHDLHVRSEEHTSELQSRENLVCRLLLEKKKENNKQDLR